MPTDPTPQARHHTVGAITLIPPLLDLLVAGQINLFRQWRPFAHPLVRLRRALISGQRRKPIKVIAIHLLLRSEGKEGYDLCRDLLAEVVGLARVICL